ncbi:aminomethyl-transferring glycine dehydrogenase subunit GcvPB [candidate division WOR-3 bacterium]|nr:aminomethyl-transferring glycine dehydrogenase subunit GcvPB [candidate division WOR-3 bacterium]
MREPLLFEIGQSKPENYTSVPSDTKTQIPKKYLRKTPPNIPSTGESSVVRHFVNLSTMNYHVDKNLYPLGSCTMKYNPKINEDAAANPRFASIHPLVPDQYVQGSLEVVGDAQKFLAELTGFDSVTLQPVAGAQSELTGIFIVRAYFSKMGKQRKKILVPDTAHGTNPATAALAGYQVVTVKSSNDGILTPKDILEQFDEETAALMVTNPNTLGLYEKNLREICSVVHDKGGIVYMDGANLNALLGRVKPAELGVDIIHFNLHKTFSSPHGGGGPGGGGIGVVKALSPFLPTPRVLMKNGKWVLENESEDSIGPVHFFYGNFGVILKAYCYLLRMGIDGLKDVSEKAIINANYVRVCLRDNYKLPYDKTCMHEAVFSGDFQKKHGVKTLDIAKAILDRGFHAPTIYFPLIVSEALMIEPTETESKKTLDSFIEVMKEIDSTSRENPDEILQCPVKTPVKRLDETMAAKELNVRYKG